MKNRFLNIVIILSIAFAALSCSTEATIDDAPIQDQESVVAISFADIATRSNGGDLLGGQTKSDEDQTTEGGVSLFEVGSQITVVGAATEPVTFTLNAEGEWISINPYEWIDSPESVYAYFGSGSSVADGEQMPDLYVAEYECGGVKPEGGVLSFTADRSFKHTSALIVVQVNNLESTIPPTVQLSNLHQISYVSNDGTYQKDASTIKSINFEMTAQDGNNYTYEAKVPSGEGNLLSDYQLKVKDENIFNYVANTNIIPTSFEANKVYTFTVNYLDAEE